MHKFLAPILVFLTFFFPMQSQAQDTLDASPVLMETIFLALDHGTRSIESGGPLIPFVMTETDGKRDLERFVAQPYEQAVAKAREAAGKLPPQVIRYAIAYDGFITVDGKKFDAIIVHGADRTSGKAYLLAQRYTPKSPAQPMQPIGNAVFLGREPALF